MPDILTIISIAIALVLAITLHEAAHGYAARFFGDRTAEMMGRVTLNPVAHIDFFGTILMPGILLLSGVPFIFGYAKPVPVDFRNLKPLRLGMISVAAAGPGINILLAWFSAILLHVNGGAETLGNDILIEMVRINIILAIFNLLPILPLDGGRILAGILPHRLAQKYSTSEPYGMLILLGLMFLPSLVLHPLGITFDPLRMVLWPTIQSVIKGVLFLAGHSI
jgi:Zn-dependent protease